MQQHHGAAETAALTDWQVLAVQQHHGAAEMGGRRWQHSLIGLRRQRSLIDPAQALANRSGPALTN